MKVKMLIAVITLVFTVSIVSAQTDKTIQECKKECVCKNKQK